MSNLIRPVSNANIKYFQSKDVRVTPAAYRGNYSRDNSGTTEYIQFDPESRLPSEFNALHNGGQIGRDTSYILD